MDQEYVDVLFTGYMCLVIQFSVCLSLYICFLSAPTWPGVPLRAPVYHRLQSFLTFACADKQNLAFKLDTKRMQRPSGDEKLQQL